MEFDLFAWLQSINYWHWWVLAGLLIFFELLAPGYIFVWIAVAAFFTGVFSLLAPLSWQVELLIFGVLSVITVVVCQKMVAKYLKNNDVDPNLNRKGAQFIGQHYKLDQAIANGSGRVKVGDSFWRVEGADLAKGTEVTVVSINGSSLVVEAKAD